MWKERMRYVVSRPIILIVAATVVTAARLTRRVEHDYGSRGRLSPGTSALAYALYLAHAALTVAVSRRSPRPLRLGREPSVALGSALALSGSLLFGAGVREFRSLEQVSGVETGRLVTTGPYRYSRNPQVVGWGLALLGAALAGRSPGALLLVTAFFLVHRRYFAVEEGHLERVFGEEYRRYRAGTPRLLGLPKGI